MTLFSPEERLGCRLSCRLPPSYAPLLTRLAVCLSGRQEVGGGSNGLNVAVATTVKKKKSVELRCRCRASSAARCSVSPSRRASGSFFRRKATESCVFVVAVCVVFHNLRLHFSTFCLSKPYTLSSTLFSSYALNTRGGISF